MSNKLYSNLHKSISNVLDELIDSNLSNYNIICTRTSSIDFANAFKAVLDDFDYYSKDSKLKLFFLNKRINTLFDENFQLKLIDNSNNSNHGYYKDCFLAILHEHYSAFTDDLDSDDMLNNAIYYFSSIINLRNTRFNIWTHIKHTSFSHSDAYLTWSLSPISRINLTFKQNLPFNNKMTYNLHSNNQKNDDFLSNPPEKVFETFDNPITDYERFIVFFENNLKTPKPLFSYRFLSNNLLFDPFTKHVEELNKNNIINDDILPLAIHKSLFYILRQFNFPTGGPFLLDRFMGNLVFNINEISYENKMQLYSIFEIIALNPTSSTWEANKNIIDEISQISPQSLQKIRIILEQDFLNNNIPVNKLKSGNILKF